MTHLMFASITTTTNITVLRPSGFYPELLVPERQTNQDFTEGRDSEWQQHQLGHMQIICTSPQTDNYTSTPPLSFLQAGSPSCHPTNSIKH